MLSSLPCFFAFWRSAIHTSSYIFNVFYSCSCHFLLAADACLSWSLPSITEQQVSPHRLPYEVLAEESQAFFKHSPHTNTISNSAILCNNYISLLSYRWFVRVRTREETNGVVKEAIVLQWAVRIASCDFKLGKKRWAGALLSEKCCCFVRKPSWRSHANLN